MAGLIPLEELFPQEETKPKGGRGTGEERQDFATVAERLMESYAALTPKGARAHPVSLRQLIARLSAAIEEPSGGPNRALDENDAQAWFTEHGFSGGVTQEQPAPDSSESATGAGHKGTALEGYAQQGSGGTAHVAPSARRTIRRKRTALTEKDVLAELQTRITQASILVGD